MLVNIYISSADKYTKTVDTYNDVFCEKIKRIKKTLKKCDDIEKFCIFAHKNRV